MARKTGPKSIDLGTLIAVTEITGGTKDALHTAQPGTVLDEATREKLGLDDAEALRLLANGALRQRNGRAAVPGPIAAGEEGATTFDGISRADLRATLNAAGVEVEDGSIEDMLTAALDHGVPEEGSFISSDDLRATLREAGVEVEDDDEIEDMLAAAIAHGQAEAFDIDAAVRALDKELNAEEVKAELASREVPFETDANKPVLLRLLAQARHAEPQPPAPDQTLV